MAKLNSSGIKKRKSKENNEAVEDIKIKEKEPKVEDDSEDLDSDEEDDDFKPEINNKSKNKTPKKGKDKSRKDLDDDDEDDDEEDDSEEAPESIKIKPKKEKKDKTSRKQKKEESSEDLDDDDDEEEEESEEASIKTRSKSSKKGKTDEQEGEDVEMESEDDDDDDELPSLDEDEEEESDEDDAENKVGKKRKAENDVKPTTKKAKVEFHCNNEEIMAQYKRLNTINRQTLYVRTPGNMSIKILHDLAPDAQSVDEIDKTSGYLFFQSQIMAEENLKKLRAKEISGLFVEIAKPTGIGGKFAYALDRQKLIVRGLPKNTTEDHLKTVFPDAKEIDLVINEEIASVTFSSDSDCKEAFEKSESLSINDKFVRVIYANIPIPRDDDSGESRNAFTPRGGGRPWSRGAPRGGRGAPRGGRGAPRGRGGPPGRGMPVRGGFRGRGTSDRGAFRGRGSPDRGGRGRGAFREGPPIKFSQNV